ncbi:MAG: type V CRISPR-associated protein Cas12a/Cpf1 [Prevotella sp.]|nr:type V CRISPR-associated protein Cas12a/Cpf1 [Prevotella sp.]
MKDLKQFIGIYPVSKTLRFELKPIGKTLEWIKKNKVLESDEQKAEDYPKVKTLIDEYHKVCICESLKGVNFDWNPLRLALKEYQSSKSDESKAVLEKEQALMRKQIATVIKDFRHYKELTTPTPQKLIDNVFPSIYESDALKSFNRFAVYFKGFQENRNNIYSSDAISTGVPYRLVHDNFPKFLADIEVFENIKTNCPEVIEQAATELQPFLEGVMIEDIFTIDFYNSLLTQDGIDFFNQVLGGVAEEGKQKYRGINEFSNLYRQQHPEQTAKKKTLTMIPLFKQILSDRDTLSYIPQQIESEQQLIELLNQFYSHITAFDYNGKTVDVLKELTKLTGNINKYNPDGIYLSAKSLTDVSQKLFSKWNVITERLSEEAIKRFGDVSITKNKKKIDAYLSKDAYALSEIPLDNDHSLSMFFAEFPKTIENVGSNWLQFMEWCKGESKQLFLNNADGTEIVKNFLDSIMEILHRCSVLVVSVEHDLDKDFYNDFLPLYAELENAVMVYNRVRNFLTKKPSDTKKFKLNFGVPSLGDGWDQNKERDNKAIILFKDGKSYLGIMNAKDMPIIKERDESTPSSYKKMIYKLLADPAKDFPHTFFSKKGIDTYHPSRYILDGREQGKYKKGETFDKKFMRDFIDFYKDAVAKHPIWSKFNFVYSPTESYEDIGAFFNEVSKQAYKIRFSYIEESQINEWTEKGQLYLFQLYNKDYAEGAHGRKNLHTLYWESLFSPENLSNIVLKLNGQAELFYRPQSIKQPFSHKTGSKMLNRRDKSGMPIPEAIYRSLYQYFNGRKAESELTLVEKSYIDQVVVKDVTHEIVKDRRYTKPEFFFHVPITFNVNADGNEYINEQVMEYLKDNPDVNIIGIDRGERHLIYLTLINQRGEILKQKTFNIVGNYNYHAKLEQREQERDQARKSWQSVGKIKELKEGFLSAVIHEIAMMMIKYNAIVVLEDLNFGFKRGRFKVERQVYQKFEKMLIDKLNYLSFKDRKPDEAGGILRGYQLTQQFTSFQRLGKQSGFLFYIPAAYTSKIDPVTGFVNHFNFNDITNAEKRKAFFMKMERIEMRNGDIEFEFDYRKYKTYQTDYQNIWTVNSSGKRIVMRIDENGRKQMTDYFPTKEIVKAFSDKNITLCEGTDLKALMAVIDTSPKNASLYGTLFYAFQKTLQMRNSDSATEEDYILSPVTQNGKQFNTKDEADKGQDSAGNWVSKFPVDADANGAYHIALKGLFLLMNQQTKKIENQKWLQFMVQKPYKS